MAVTRDETMPIRTGDDVVLARHAVRTWATRIGFSIVDQTKIVTAASELARNTLDHGGGGEMRLEELDADGRHGLRLTFEDRGPGIADIALAMKDGYSTGGGLGFGLGGARRLVNEFQIQSKPGEGTKVTVVRWK